MSVQCDLRDIVSVPLTEITVEMGLVWDFVLMQWWPSTLFPTVSALVSFLCSGVASV